METPEERLKKEKGRREYCKYKITVEESNKLSKEDFSEIIKENAEKDVVIKTNNDVIFTFPMGTSICWIFHAIMKSIKK